MVTISSTVYCVCDMYACITGNINDITVKHRHSVQQAAACTATDASSHFKHAVWFNHAVHAYTHSRSCQSPRMRSDQFCRVCWPTIMSVCLDQVPRLVMQHLERHVTLFSGLCDGWVANVILSIAAMMSTTSGLGKDIGIVLMVITLQLHPTAKLQLQSWPS